MSTRGPIHPDDFYGVIQRSALKLSVESKCLKFRVANDFFFFKKRMRTEEQLNCDG